MVGSKRSIIEDYVNEDILEGKSVRKTCRKETNGEVIAGDEAFETSPSGLKLDSDHSDKV